MIIESLLRGSAYGESYQEMNMESTDDLCDATMKMPMAWIQALEYKSFIKDRQVKFISRINGV